MHLFIIIISYNNKQNFIVGMETKEKIAKQRQMLNAKLGLEMASQMGMDISEIFSNEDLVANVPERNNISAEENNVKVSFT